MEFQQALLWTALTLMIGCFVYIFYALIKEYKDDKDDRNQKNKKRNDWKLTTANRAGKSTIAKVNQGGTGIATQISNISQGNVNVVNITNYPAGSDQESKERHSVPARDMASPTGTPCETQKRSSHGKVRKGGQGFTS